MYPLKQTRYQAKNLTCTILFQTREWQLFQDMGEGVSVGLQAWRQSSKYMELKDLCRPTSKAKGRDTRRWAVRGIDYEHLQFNVNKLNSSPPLQFSKWYNHSSKYWDSKCSYSPTSPFLMPHSHNCQVLMHFFVIVLRALHPNSSSLFPTVTTSSWFRISLSLACKAGIFLKIYWHYKDRLLQ